MKWKNELKGYFLSPLFALVFSLCFCSSIVNLILVFFPQTASWITKDWELLDWMTNFCYGFLILSLLCLFRDFKRDRKLPDYFAYILLACAALARERGIQHWLPSKDTTFIKTRFFVNPENPLSEKIIGFVALALIVGAAAYVLCKYVRYYIPGFFRLDTLSWSVISLGVCGIFAKFIDRLPNGPISEMLNFGELYGKNLEMYHNNLSVLEEMAEMLIPINAIILLWQYHVLSKS